MGSTTPIGSRSLRATSRHGQAGVSLIEVLIAMAVLVPLTLASAMGLMTTLRASDQAQQRQQLNVALTNATETLRALPYLPCGGTEEYQKLYGRSDTLAVAEPMSVGAQLSPPAIDAVAYWNEEKRAYVEECTRDGGAQRVTMTVISQRLGTATGSIVITELPSQTGEPR